MEEYRVIEGFENYEVSNLGNVRNKTSMRILKNNPNSRGYYIIDLYRNKIRSSKMIHRLVANEFIGNPNNKACVDHIDGNKLNNFFSNLRWASTTENCRNTKLKCTNTTGVKGVTQHKVTNKWHATIQINGIKVHIGSFDTIEQAKQARQIRANEAFGDYTNACEKI